MAILWLRKSSEQDRERKGAVRSCGHYSNWRGRLCAREAQQKQQAAERERARATRRVCGAGAGGEEERAAHTIQRYPKFPLCASELSCDCAKYVDWPRAVYRLQRDAIWPALVDGLLSLQVRQTANSWGEPNEEWTMNGGVRWGRDTPLTYEPAVVGRYTPTAQLRDSCAALL